MIHDVGVKNQAKAKENQQYFAKLGSEFAAGFLFGAQIGGFTADRLYHCMMDEQNSFDMFYKADVEMKKGLKAGDPTIIINGLDDMVRFVYDLMMENSGGKLRDSGDEKHAIC